MISTHFKKIVFIFFTLVFPLILVSLSHKDSQMFQAASSFTHPIRRFFSHYIRSVSDTVSLYTYLTQVKKNNRILKNENAQLKIKLLQMEDVQNENSRLSNMLQLSQNSSFSLIPARVIAQDPFPNSNLLTIDKGENVNIKKNMGALVENGVAGYVFRVYSNTAQVLLLSDRKAVLPARIERSRVYGLIEGKSRTALYLKYLNNEDDVLPGDRVVTSGIDSFFPPGLPIGSVSEIQKEEYGMNQEVKVRPYVKASQIEELFIILKNTSKGILENNLQKDL